MQLNNLSESKVKLVWYDLITSDSEYKITESQKEAILKAEQTGRKFVNIGEAVINIAFIREMRRHEEVQDFSEMHPLPEGSKKYIVLNENEKKQLRSGDSGSSSAQISAG